MACTYVSLSISWKWRFCCGCNSKIISFSICILWRLRIIVWECESLKSLFPAYVARFRMQAIGGSLDSQMWTGGSCCIWRWCTEAVARLVFPEVTLLMLKKLPKLKWFSRGVHTLNVIKLRYLFQNIWKLKEQLNKANLRPPSNNHFSWLKR